MPTDDNIVQAPVFAVSRLRTSTDGRGITTLVAFMGCPLKCRYCLNDVCHEPIYGDDGKLLHKNVMMLTPQKLYDMVKLDNIYFQVTGGGICFGGGEPTLYSGFIEEFRNICGKKWQITLETSLACSFSTIKRLSNVVDHWIVDVKSLEPSIYKQYTGKRSAVMQHLKSLKNNVKPEQVTVKLPVIAGFNDERDLESDKETIRRYFGFTDIVMTRYIIPYKFNQSKNNETRKRKMRNT